MEVNAFKPRAIGRLALVFGILLSGWASAASPQGEDYFGHLMFRESPYASYRGIYPLDANRPPALAHYAFTHDAEGRVTRIRYQVGDKAIRRNEVWDSFIWFAPEVRITYGEGIETHRYYGLSGTRISAHGGVYEARYELDAQGRRRALAFFDAAGAPVESEWGISRYQWRHADGIVFEQRFGLDGEQRTMRPELEFHEVAMEYDRDGKLVRMRNLGLDGVPTNNASGAGMDRITYDLAGNFIRWQVYDKDFNPVEGNEPMVHLGEHLYDASGNKIGMRGFDRQGNRIAFSWGSWEHLRDYNAFGNQVSHAMFDAQGKSLGNVAFDYNEDQTAIVRIRAVDDQGELTASSMLGGAAMVEYQFAEDGSISPVLRNADGSDFTPPQRADS